MICTFALILSIILLGLQKSIVTTPIARLYRLIVFVLIVGSFILFSVIIALQGPQIRISISDWQEPSNQITINAIDKAKWNVIFDSHFHTRYSDGSMTLEEGIWWHIACGFNAFAVTDHNTVKNIPEILKLQEKYKDKCIILPGIEIDGFNGHMNVIGLKSWDTTRFLRFQTTEDIKTIIKEAHKQGAVVTWNHYPWSYWGKIPRYSLEPTREEVLSWGVDFIEVSNWDDDIAPIDNITLKFAEKHPEMGKTVGTDVHLPTKDRLYGWTLLSVPKFTPEALMQELRSKRTDVFLVDEGMEYPTKHKPSLWYRIFRPFYQIGQIFINLHRGGAVRNLDRLGVFIWFLMLLGIYGVLEMILYYFII